MKDENNLLEYCKESPGKGHLQTKLIGETLRDYQIDALTCMDNGESVLLTGRQMGWTTMCVLFAGYMASKGHLVEVSFIGKYYAIDFEKRLEEFCPGAISHQIDSSTPGVYVYSVETRGVAVDETLHNVYIYDNVHHIVSTLPSFNELVSGRHQHLVTVGELDSNSMGCRLVAMAGLASLGVCNVSHHGSITTTPLKHGGAHE